MRKRQRVGLILLCTLAATATAGEYSPAAGENIPRRALFGDLHLHSRSSTDSYAMGNTSLTAADAYRFARGEQLTSSTGLPVRLRRPLDFLAVTDHAEFLGVLNAFHQGNKSLLKSPLGQRWSALSEDEFLTAFVQTLSDPDPVRDDVPDSLESQLWRDVVNAAEEFYAPGQFTTFTAYEWTADSEGNNLHRCVIYRDGPTKTAGVLPYSSMLSDDPEDLWEALAKYEEKTGGDVLAIPHNGNLSNGIMWDVKTLAGRPLSKDYALRRMRFEPVVETTQVKGDSETHPILSPHDPFADFERWDRFNIMNTAVTTPDMLPGSYVRSALKRGLSLQEKLGANPYQFGQLGSTDSHTSLSTAAEDNFFGKFANSEPGARNPESMMAGMKYADWELSASGLAAVWAPENNREAIFDAIRRKEVYATTGSRISLRFFGGWDFGEGALHKPDFAQMAYQQGVPMGGNLSPAPDIERPEFLAYALRDPDGVNLERLQIIKGWVDGNGVEHERIYDVATTDTGTAELSAQWRDPDFDPADGAFYYARVIEVPRPRWTAIDQAYYGAEVHADAPVTIQDRAYSSPIWYTPR